MPKILVIDCSTGEEVIRDMNKEELAEYEKTTVAPTPKEI
jgi:hypothetical protein